jgi:hypothetical protein
MSAPSKKILIRKNPLNQKKKKIIILNEEDKAQEVTVPVNANAWDETINFQGRSNNNAIDRHGYYLPPSTGRTITIRKHRTQPLYVDTRIPLPPPLTNTQQEAGKILHEENQGEEPTVRLPTIANLNKRNDLLLQNERDLYSKNVTPCRIIRKFISSLNKTGSASNFTFDISEPLKRITKVKFVSVNITYLVPAAPPTNAFIYLDAFPLFENPSYYETELGTKYSAHLPIITGTVGSTINSFYAFPLDYYMYLTNSPSDTVNTFNVKLLKEDTTVVPGDIVDFSDVSYATLELEFYMENLVF